jgi:4-amino-4-deoxy-L-arabinose transferase-like glycosyltransferase
MKTDVLIRARLVAKNLRKPGRLVAAEEPVAAATPDWLRPWMVIVLALVILASFLGKSITIDDPLFIWQAKHLQQKPFDPFGFETNWFGASSSMLINVQNPPLTCYWLAMAGLVSWKEVWLHLTMLPFALLVLIGVIRLARQLGADPFWAALLTVGSAGFLVSATNLMCDVMMLCGMVWSIALWVEGLNRNKVWILLATAVLAGLTALTKYFGISLIPLLAVYTIIRQKRATWLLAPLLVTVAILVGWHFWTMRLYNVSHVLGAARYAENIKERFDNGGRYFAAVTFLGGCILWPLVIALWRMRLAGRSFFAIVALLGGHTLGLLSGQSRFPPPDSSYIFASVFFAAGAAVLWLTAEFHWKYRQRSETWLITLWIWGTIMFAGAVNWTVAARNLLPMIPALALVATMRPYPRGKAGDRREPSHEQQKKALPLVSFAVASALGLAFSVLATWADFDWSNDVRRAAAELADKYEAQGRQVFFQGHWGFQYYMELAGARDQDVNHIVAGPNVVSVLPFNNSNVIPNALNGWQLVDTREERSGGGFYLSDPTSGAGFYSHLLGILPMSFATGTPDRYYVLRPPPQRAIPRNPQ